MVQECVLYTETITHSYLFCSGHLVCSEQVGKLRKLFTEWRFYKEN